MSNIIQTAELDWQLVDGIDVPISKQFGDVYFSKDNGLLETRHVFLNGNDLTERLSNLADFEYFSVAETGFGTGLNILALWQLWEQVRPNNQSHLHAISVEKFPLSKTDLIRALNAWPELRELSNQLIEQYPLPIAGCHRLSFPKARFSIDLWLGDAQDIFPSMEKIHPVNAWFLDGFAPSCNPDMWEENVLKNIVRLSDIGTTFASFSVAGILKRGLKQYGISISRPRGFGHKREMLKAIWQQSSCENLVHLDSTLENTSRHTRHLSQKKNKQQHFAIIGAGIAGLSTAWALAQRGHKIVIYDQSAPLAGGSGNPLALLNPKLCNIEQSSEHLMTLAWQHALNFYRQFDAFRPIQVQQLALKNAEDLLQLAKQYPAEILHACSAQAHSLNTNYASLNLRHAGAISPHMLAEQILQHPRVTFVQANITRLAHDLTSQRVQIYEKDQLLTEVDSAIVCTARHSEQFFKDYPKLKPIRGQVSWVNNQKQPLEMNQAQSYGGYCMQLDTETLILGASFYPNRDDAEVLLEDHAHNYALIESVFPEYAKTLAPIDTWQGRASVRAQSQDYFPVLGQPNASQSIFTLAGLGSKGFLFAPLCSEVMCALILKETSPIPSTLLKKLLVTRFEKKPKVKKPYFKQNSFNP